MKKLRIISGQFDKEINSKSMYEAIKQFAEYIAMHNAKIEHKTRLYSLDDNPLNVYIVIDVEETLKQNISISDLN